MTDFNVQIKADPTSGIRDADRFDKKLKTVEGTANKVKAAVASAFALTGIALSLQGLISFSDETTNAANRIRVLTDTTAELTRTQRELFDVANDTRQSYTATVTLYTRTAQAAKSLGRSQQELINFTRSLNKEVAISGASAMEANAAIIQLSQGLGSGALRGDELRSVLEQLPTVADVIARHLKVTRGELRKLGTEGKITAETILDAFRDAETGISERFEKTLPTISQSFTVLRNRALEMFAALNTGFAITERVAGIILYLADNFEYLSRIILAASIALGTAFAVMAVGAAITAITALTAIMLANPVGAFITAVVLAVSWLVAFADKIKLNSESIIDLRDIGRAAFNVLSKSVSSFVEKFRKEFAPLFSLFEGLFGDISFSLEDILKTTARVSDKIIGSFVGDFNAIVFIFKGLADIVENAFIDAVNASIRGVEIGINKIGGLLNKIGGKFGKVEFSKLDETIAPTFAEIGEQARVAFLEGYNQTFFQDVLSGIIDDAGKLAAERIRKQQEVAEAEAAAFGPGGTPTLKAAAVNKFEEILKLMRKENELLKVNGDARLALQAILRAETKLKRELTDAEISQITVLSDINAALTRQSEILESITAPLTSYKNTQAALNALLLEGSISLAEYNRVLNETALLKELADVRSGLDTTGDTGAITALEDEYASRQAIIDQALEARLISEQEFFALSSEAHTAYNNGIKDIESKRTQFQLQTAGDAFGSLASMFKGHAQQQSGIYKALFVVSKAFAIADAAVQISSGIAKAANNPWPLNLAAMASVAAATASIVSNIQSVQMAGSFQTGGEFMVGGSGGADSQTVAFKASPNEVVSVRTPSQQSVSERERNIIREPTPAPNIINVFDVSLVGDFLQTADGEEAIVNVIRNNRDSLGL